VEFAVDFNVVSVVSSLPLLRAGPSNKATWRILHVPDRRVHPIVFHTRSSLGLCACLPFDFSTALFVFICMQTGSPSPFATLQVRGARDKQSSRTIPSYIVWVSSYPSHSPSKIGNQYPSEYDTKIS
jgi:hypothetical protein